MTAMTYNRDTREIVTPARWIDPVAAGAQIFRGSIVGLDTLGNAVPASPTGVTVRGRCMSHSDNRNGNTGDLNVETASGIWVFMNDGTIDRAYINKDVFVLDDQTVAASGTVIAGICRDVREDGVAVEFY